MKKIYFLLFITCFFSILAISQINGQKTGDKNDLKKADEYFNNGKFSLAEIFYLKALNEQPDNFSINLNLGKIYFHNEAYKKAIPYFQTAYDINPKIDVLYYMAGCYAEENNPEKALSIYSNILRLNPDYASAHLDAGNIGLRKLYNKEITIVHWEEFLILRPNDPQVPNIKKALAYLKDPNFVLNPPNTASGTNKAGISSALGGTNASNLDLLPEIQGKDIKSESEEKYNLKSKKTITTE